MTAPGTEARRTNALLLACLVPLGAGLLFLAASLTLASVRGVHPNEWWFGTMPDWRVWSILIALGPVACLGRCGARGAGRSVAVVPRRRGHRRGGTGRREPGAMSARIETSRPTLRLWAPWAIFHFGSTPEGTAEVGASNPGFYPAYLLCLCAVAGLVAIWHDRTARTGRLRGAVVAVTVVGLAFLALSMTTGPSENRRSEPVPATASS